MFKKGQIVPNAKKFKPGQSGNPKGRPRKTPISDAYFRLLESKMKKLAVDIKKDTIAEAFAKVMLQQALKGNVHAAEMINSRVEGPANVKFYRDEQGEGQIEIEAKLGNGDLVGAISSIYGIKIIDARPIRGSDDEFDAGGGRVIIDTDRDAAAEAAAAAAAAAVGDGVITIAAEASGGSEAGGSPDQPVATLSLPETVD
jgi:uncharacterized protein DUF5681